MGHIVIAGGTGFIGKHITEQARRQGHEVVILSRSNRAASEGIRYAQWDGETLGDWAQHLEGAHGVINLSGASIASPWRGNYVQKLYDSRVKPTTAIAQAIAAAKNPPRAWANSSGIGIYGEGGNATLSEASPIGTGPIADLATAWEEATRAAGELPCSVALIRTSMVLGPDGGAFPPMARAAKFGAGGPFGDGQFWQAWIHVEDLARMYLFALDHQLNGPVVASAPSADRNADFMAALRAAVNAPFGLPAPAFALRAMCNLMHWPEDFLTQSQRAVPEIAKARGFVWAYPQIRAAMRACASG